jgi:hypothetical protein
MQIINNEINEKSAAVYKKKLSEMVFPAVNIFFQVHLGTFEDGEHVT